MVNSQDVKVGASSLETDSCPKSTVDINSKMESKNVLTRAAKRRRRRIKQRNKHNATENDFKDGKHSTDSDSVKIRATEIESTLQSPASICLRNESGMEQPIAKVNSSVGKSRRKKRKARDEANGEHSEKEVDSFLQPVDTCSKNESEAIAEVSLSTKRREDKKWKHNALGSNLDVDLTEAEGKHSERQDFKSVPEVAVSNLEILKECKFDNNGVGTLSVETVELKSCRREQIDEKKEKMKTYQRKRRKSADQLENSLKQFEMPVTRQVSDDAQIPGLLENEIKKIKVGGQVLSMKGLELKEASANYCDGELVRKESKKRNQKKSFKVTTHKNEKDVTLQDTAEDNIEKEIRGNGDKVEMTVHGMGHVDNSAYHFHEKTCDNLSAYDKCELPEVKDVEMETKMVENVPTFHHVGACKDLEDTSKEENVPRMLQSSSDSGYPCSTKKKLLILDLNGILVDIVPSDSCLSETEADIIVSGKAVFKRPFCDEFLQFCFERFNVGVWSSRLKKNVDRVVNFLMGDDRRKLLFRWSHCTATRFTTVEQRGKPLLLKELKKLWEKVAPKLPWEKGEYNESNTLLLDDSPYKALRNPAHTAIFPHPYDSSDAEDCSLGPGGDIRMYLEGVAGAENVQTYVQQNPFGQPPITESDPSWGFYCKVINADC
ncbi:uncharacterized protein LOC119987149 isoform X2 [Tripterygium wilfordii]|uniref:uncharacterized protein LOC119987149 isoform X2 n=1 Tax=Tripterygium wilfordii TaxID=458696 RepID=UPI0018F80105|nr:uncharacterized protein LOC119987149 isoform X2 [Tripterygium wilfordii]